MNGWWGLALTLGSWAVVLAVWAWTRRGSAAEAEARRRIHRELLGGQPAEDYRPVTLPDRPATWPPPRDR